MHDRAEAFREHPVIRTMSAESRMCIWCLIEGQEFMYQKHWARCKLNASTTVRYRVWTNNCERHSPRRFWQSVGYLSDRLLNTTFFYDPLADPKQAGVDLWLHPRILAQAAFLATKHVGKDDPVFLPDIIGQVGEQLREFNQIGAENVQYLKVHVYVVFLRHLVPELVCQVHQDYSEQMEYTTDPTDLDNALQAGRDQAGASPSAGSPGTGQAHPLTVMGTQLAQTVGESESDDDHAPPHVDNTVNYVAEQDGVTQSVTAAPPGVGNVVTTGEHNVNGYEVSADAIPEPHADVKITTREDVDPRKVSVRDNRKTELRKVLRSLSKAGFVMSWVERGVMPQFHNFFGLATKEAKLYVADPFSELNVRFALGKRHFRSDLPEPKEYMLVILDYLSNIMTAQILEQFLSSGMGSMIEAALTVDYCMLKSNKWSPERWLRQARNEALKLYDIDHEKIRKAGLPRQVALKKNEALDKEKPRALLSTKDKGTFIHTHDAGFFEKGFFHISHYTDRSTKYVSPVGMKKRVAKFLAPFATGYTGSMDFGSFDATLKSHIRDRLENKILPLVLQYFLKGMPTAKVAAADRVKKSCNAFWGHLKIHVENMIRESGDRGTSICNYLCNRYAFLAAYVAEELYSQGLLPNPLEYDSWDKNYKFEPWKFEEAEKSRFKAVLGRATTWASGKKDPVYGNMQEVIDLLGEGDDGLQAFSKEYIDNRLPGFGRRWVKWYRHMGLCLEPQGVDGEVPEDLLDKYAFLPTGQRVEFVSKLWIPYAKFDKTFYGMMPKPRKTFTNSLVSFAVTSKAEDAGFTQHLAMAENCIDCPIMFRYAIMMANYYSEKGGTYDENSLDAWKRAQCKYQRIAELTNAHVQTLTDSAKVAAVRAAFARETGLTADRQTDLEVQFAGARDGGGRQTALCFLATLGVVRRD